jgi:hypothetical protein
VADVDDEINECCGGMATMIKDGTIAPFIDRSGGNTGQMFVRGTKSQIFNYEFFLEWITDQPM